MYRSCLTSPIGTLVIEGDDACITFIGFSEEAPVRHPSVLTELACKELSDYFEGNFAGFSFRFQQPGTEFQQQVWSELINITIGKTISYAKLSQQMNNPKAIRAIAAANGRNGLLIVVPCHRVIGSSGDLVGFSAGLWRKKWLLEHEARITGQGQTLLPF